jgi:ATP-dependent Clp protease ATP-binding subunit ClpA
MTDLDAYKDKFSESGKRILDGALQESRRRDQNFISVEHILNALAEEETELFNFG